MDLVTKMTITENEYKTLLDFSALLEEYCGTHNDCDDCVLCNVIKGNINAGAGIEFLENVLDSLINDKFLSIKG
ncbi:MAG: hypothetical protein J6W64_03435 [Bacilli bacterium]|nr:hypothetical protein [Bacilli bacterium]